MAPIKYMPGNVSSGRPPSRLFPFGFSTHNLYAFLFCPIRATYPAKLILLNFIILIKIGQEYKSLQLQARICEDGVNRLLIQGGAEKRENLKLMLAAL
jgi:hypothetical protein